jgi:N-acetylneuraminic acid mutarotase
MVLAACGDADSWRRIARHDAGPGRAWAAAVWTGTEMLVWGGLGASEGSALIFADGARYDPVENAWVPMTRRDAPAPRFAHSAVWTGTEMIVWGGVAFDDDAPTGTGARYDPGADEWRPMSRLGAPDRRVEQTAIWTGTEMVVWGGGDGTATFGDGGRYDPETDTWSALSAVNAPSPRVLHTAVWTGTEMIVWGGSSVARVPDMAPLDDGAAWDALANTWRPLSSLEAPAPRAGHVGVWTGTAMIVWGGADEASGSNPADVSLQRDGGSYVPGEDRWTSIATVGAPEAAWLATGVWTGSELVVWGAVSERVDALHSEAHGDGGRYDPLLDAWVPISSHGEPDAAWGSAAVWTGDELLVWSGTGSPVGPTRGGAAYRPR